MTIQYGSTQIPNLQHGSINIKEVYYEKTLVYRKVIPPTRFNPSANFQEFVVPNAVYKLNIQCVASKGKDGNAVGGKGGKVTCTLSVQPKQKLFIMVGGIPTDLGKAVYNASDIRTNNAGVIDNASLQSRLVIAGGGGNGGTGNQGTQGDGGAGGGLTGGKGTNKTDWGTNAAGGTQTEGGNAGGVQGYYYTAGKKGALGLGGDGGSYGGGFTGGAGGAGYYGGGGGSSSAWYTYCGTGGGGGSSFTNSSKCSNVKHTQGANNGAGYIIIQPVY